MVIWTRSEFHSKTKVQVTSSRLKCSFQRDKDGCNSQMDILTKYGMVHVDEAQVHDVAFIFDLEYRNAVLSRGMHHKVFWLCLSAQVTHVSCWETQKPHVHISWVCQSKPGGTSFWKLVGTVLCQPSQRLVVWISVAPVLETGGTGFYWICNG